MIPRSTRPCFRAAAILTISVAIVATILPARVRAQNAPDSVKASPPPAKRPCAAPEFHQFDFWIGTWEVRMPDGKVAGTNRIEPILDGCVLQETWRGAKGLQGSSLNMYVPSTKRWHQTWMDQQGTLLLLDGSFRDGAMTMTGEAPSVRKPGTTALQRVTWTPSADGGLRQVWETSDDAGKTWNTVFDGSYTRIR
ncbi:MAG TPA: hypothetical protein VFV24_07430 [Candidatus Eisenbacteria bacterium]|nr:hypothetical protein [Candidatus Eisenbacteria bacterium]